MPTEKITFQNSDGHDIAALVDAPDGEPLAWALFAHCFTCSKNLKIVARIAQRLNDEGVGLMRFDFTGLGESGGEFAETTFTGNVGDLERAAAWLGEHREAPSILVGHSLGGAAVLAAASRIDTTRCVATIGAPSEPAHVRHLVTGADFDRRGRAQVSIGGRPFEIGKGFVEDLEAHDLASEIAAMGVPLMIFHSPVDNVVGIDQAERIYKAARHPKSFVSLGRADHLLTKDRDAEMVGHVLAAWAHRYARGE